MPTYQYACTSPDCGNRFELVQSFTDPSVSECPVCNSAVRKVYGSVGVVFKGSGFYRNDSRSEATSALSKAEGKKSEGKSSEGKSSDGKSSEGTSSAKADSSGTDGKKSESKSTDKAAASSGGSSSSGNSSSGSNSSGSTQSGRAAASA